jgi:hypothetical protein
MRGLDLAEAPGRKNLPGHYGQQDLSADATATLENI